MASHPSAVVAPEASLGADVEIGPYAVVEAGAVLGARVVLGPGAVVGSGVTLGDGVVLGPAAVVTGRTTIGPGTRLDSGAAVGGEPQDLSYRGEPTECIVGARCVLREHATIHRGTPRGRGRTVVGDDVYMMAASHIGHDCIVGNSVILSNAVLVAGHAEIGDFAILGGGAAVVQRIRIGTYAFISGLCGVTKDVVPYAYVVGHRGRLDSLNLVGLKRRGFARDDLNRLLAAYAILFEEGPLMRDRLVRLEAEMGADPLVRPILDFIAAAPRRPLLQRLTRPGRTLAADDALLEADR